MTNGVIVSNLETRGLPYKEWIIVPSGTEDTARCKCSAAVDPGFVETRLANLMALACVLKLLSGELAPTETRGFVGWAAAPRRRELAILSNPFPRI